MQVPEGKKIYFLSDFHLGAPDFQRSLERERTIVRFLKEIGPGAAEIFLVGDLFDFWYEYRRVVPKGHTRLLGRLAELSDAGVTLHFFAGNHDMWMKTYFQEELGIPVYFEPREFLRNGRKIWIGHGDGLGPGDHGYKMIKKVFRNPVCQGLFGLLPPFLGMGLANYLSRRSRAQTGSAEEVFLGEDREWLIQYCREVLTREHYDFFIFGHRHLPIDFQLAGGSRYLNLGDWIRYDTYAVLDGTDLQLKSYNGSDAKIIRR